MDTLYNTDDIKILNITNEIENLLKSNKLSKIKDICNLKRKDFKNLGLKDTDINHIIIKMQLNGFDLGKNGFEKKKLK